MNPCWAEDLVVRESGGDADRTWQARVLSAEDPDDRSVLDDLWSDVSVHFIDTWQRQLAHVAELRGVAGSELTAEAKKWVYYPWRRTVVSVLADRPFHALRLDRNRNLITAQEQSRLRRLRVGVAGLSVGHAIAHVIAAEGLCGELRLADFDELELSNLNRIPATVLDIGLNKAVVAARRIAEVDPYLSVQVFESGITPESLEAFLDGLDILVEECDSLDMKLMIREAARARGLPVVMATGDRGMIDVERFDIDPTRPILHGLVGDLQESELRGLTSKDKVPHVLRILEGDQLSARLAASMVEVSHSVSTWPQRASEVIAGAAAVAEAVRRIGLGEALSSGRIRLDVAAALDGIGGGSVERRKAIVPCRDQSFGPMSRSCDIVATAATRAPSGGNVQPWAIGVTPDEISVRLAPQYTSIMDVSWRGSAVAVGAAVFNARVAAAAQGVLGPVSIESGDDEFPLRAVVRLDGSADCGAELARLYQPMMDRATNRHLGTPKPIRESTIHALTTAAEQEGCRVRLILPRDEIAQAATILAESDRIRYLTPNMHAEMFSELRWPGEDPKWGLDVRTLELDPSDLAALDVLRRAEVMEQLARWNEGAALGEDMHKRVSASTALAVVSVRGKALVDFARGGSATEAVWIAANQCGLGVQPVSPPFLYVNRDAELRGVSPRFAASLSTLRSNFRALARTADEESLVLILRLTNAPPPSVRSQRSQDRIVQAACRSGCFSGNHGPDSAAWR